MKKMKITEAQAKILKEMGKKKVLKVTQEQYNRIVESEQVNELEFVDTGVNDLLIAIEGGNYVLINKDDKRIESIISPIEYIQSKEQLCAKAMDNFNELFEGKRMEEARFSGSDSKIIAPLASCDINLGEEAPSTADVIDRNFKKELSKDTTASMKKFNIKEVYEEFVNEVYGLNESEGKHNKLISLMEAAGMISNNRIKKEAFCGEKETVMEAISAGLTEVCNGGSAYRAMETIEEVIKSREDIIQSLKNQLPTTPKKTGKSKEELMAAIAKKRAESQAITAQKEKEREDAIRAMAQRENAGEEEVEETTSAAGGSSGAFVGKLFAEELKALAESMEADNLASAIIDAMGEIDEDMHYRDFAIAVASILVNEYGSHNYEGFMEVLKKHLGEEAIEETTTTMTAGNYQYDANAFKAGGDVDMTGKDNELREDSHDTTQWKGGSFVKVKDNCKEYPYCNQGADAIETSKTKDAVISNDHIIQEVAEKTGKTIEEVKSIIEKHNNKK